MLTKMALHQISGKPFFTKNATDLRHLGSGVGAWGTFFHRVGFNLFALFFELLEIFSELAGFVDRHYASQLAKSASTDACLRSLCPLHPLIFGLVFGFITFGWTFRKIWV
jgi:hypothetical protein